jgi:hypothetical protein
VARALRYNRLNARRVTADATVRDPSRTVAYSYTSEDFRELVKKNGMHESMSRKAECWDNAIVERLFGALKSVPGDPIWKIALLHTPLCSTLGRPLNRGPSADEAPPTPLLLPAAICAAIGIPALSVSFIKLLDPATTGEKLADLLKSQFWVLFAVGFAIAFAPPIALLLGRITSGELSAGEARRVGSMDRDPTISSRSGQESWMAQSVRDRGQRTSRL